MAKLFSAGLRTRLLISMGLVCCVIVVLVSLVELFQHRYRQRQQILEEFSSFEAGAARTIREAVWRYDWDMVKTIIETQTSKKISYLEICDTKAPRCEDFGQRDVRPYLERRSAMVYVSANGKPMQIGVIYMQGHYDTIWNHLRDDLLPLLLTNGFSVFGVAIILYTLFHRQAMRRLLELERFTRKIDLQKIDEDRDVARFVRGEKGDEIDALADAITGLTERVRDELERRRQLEQQLTQAQKMEALGTLAGGIAHDFNNILTAILGYAELSCLKSERGTEQHKNLEKIVKAGQRARNLISQILVFSRRSEGPREVVKLATVVEEALGLVTASLSGRIRVITELDPTITILGDATRLHQVVMNLATNGAQAMEASAGETDIGAVHQLRVTLRRQAVKDDDAERLILEPGDYGLLEISDTGPGIPVEIQARIFEPFFTTKAAGKGTGMGLAVVHGIVQSHGGTVMVESDVGVGTTFSIYLPVTDRNLIDQPPADSVERGQGERLLVVDDEEQVLELGTDILKDLGYTVHTCSSPEQAYAYLAEENPVDLLVTDLTMPGMNGVELATRAKSLRPDLPVLLWTGYQDWMGMDATEEVVAMVLQKPFTRVQLGHAVREILEKT